MKKQLLIAAACLLLFIADRFVKYLIIKTPASGFLLTKNIEIKLYLNKGLAFGLPLPNMLNAALAAIIIVIIIHFLLKLLANHYYFLALSLITVGALSNLIDRVRFGAVVDYLSIYFWPAFNLADSYILIGLIIFFFVFKYYSWPASKTVAAEDSKLAQKASK